MDEIMVNGELFVKKSIIREEAKPLDGLAYVLVRTHSAGVFAGYLESQNGQEVILRDARMIWYWEGACSLSQLAEDGTAAPKKCKFTVPVKKVKLLNVIAVYACAEKSRVSIAEVPAWKV